MKVIVIARLRNTSHAQMREGVENFVKHGAGASGMETLWASADAKTVIALYEVDDVAELHKNATLYAPYFEHVETHLVTDSSVSVANTREALDLVS
jgi:hypothetical protein